MKAVLAIGIVAHAVLGMAAHAEEAGIDVCHALADRGAEEARSCYHSVLEREAHPAQRAEVLCG